MSVKIFKVLGVLVVILISGFLVLQLIDSADEDKDDKDDEATQQATPDLREPCDISLATYAVEIQVVDALSGEPIQNATVTIQDNGELKNVADCVIETTPELIASVDLEETADETYVGEVTGSATVQQVDILIEADGYQSRQLTEVSLATLSNISEIRFFPLDE